MIAESGLNDPKVMRERGARRLGLRRRLGGRLPPRAARRPDRGDRRLVRGVRDARHAGQGVPPPARPRRHLLDASAGAASARPPTTSPPERFVVFSANHDQVGNRAFGDRLPVAARPLAALLTTSGTVHADALPGGGVRRDRAVPVLLGPHRRRRSPTRPARGGGASSPRSRRSSAQIPDPQDPETFARVQADARRASPRACATLYRGRAGAAARAAGRPPPRRRADGRRLTVRRGRHRILANFGEDDRGRWTASRCSSPAALRDGALPPLAGAVVR